MYLKEFVMCSNRTIKCIVMKIGNMYNLELRMNDCEQLNVVLSERDSIICIFFIVARNLKEELTRVQITNGSGKCIRKGSS